jgi:peptidoglycan/LPS O-acetylase OafA/YrhL
MKFSRELQSMRGLAALVVVVGHCYAVFDLSGSTLSWAWTLLNGQGAVVLFFVLSGFVLSLQWKKATDSPRAIIAYTVRRVTRLYPMLLVTVVVGTLYCNFIHLREPILFATTWYYGAYVADIDLFHFLTSAIGYSGKPAPPLWSLWVELIGSALIPLFMMVEGRGRPVIGALLLVASFTLDHGFHFNTPVYLIDFYVGVSIGWWGCEFVAAFEKLALPIRALICAASALVFYAALPLFPPDHSVAIFNFLEMISVAPVIALLYFGKRRPSVLRGKFVAWLGDISFSVYVLHFPLMYLLVHLMTKLAFPLSAVPVEFIALALAASTTAITIFVSGLSYRFIELPCLRLGQRLATMLQTGRGRLGDTRAQ